MIDISTTETLTNVKKNFPESDINLPGNGISRPDFPGGNSRSDLSGFHSENARLADVQVAHLISVLGLVLLTLQGNFLTLRALHRAKGTLQAIHAPPSTMKY